MAEVRTSALGQLDGDSWNCKKAKCIEIKKLEIENGFPVTF